MQSSGTENAMNPMYSHLCSFGYQQVTLHHEYVKGKSRAHAHARNRQHDGRIAQQQYKIFVVVEAYACAEPVAVVVLAKNASHALAAVVGTRRDETLARFALCDFRRLRVHQLPFLVRLDVYYFTDLPGASLEVHLLLRGLGRSSLFVVHAHLPFPVFGKELDDAGDGTDRGVVGNLRVG